MRRTLLLLAVPLALAACAEIDAGPESTIEFEQSITITADDGTTFEASIVHDGMLTPEQELVMLDSIEVVAVGVTPADVDIVPVVVPAEDMRWDPHPDTDVSVYVTGTDGDTFVGNYRWGWIDDIEQEDIEAFIDDVCPPWH